MNKTLTSLIGVCSRPVVDSNTACFFLVVGADLIT